MNCVLPFTHVAIRSDGSVKPCCRFQPSKLSPVPKLNKNLNGIFNSDFFNNLRKGEMPFGCYDCIIEEENNKISMREKFNKLLKKTKEPKLKYLEIGLSNICNLKCRTCDTVLSSAWYDDDKLLDSNGIPDRSVSYPKHTKIDIDYIDSEILENLELLKIVGGEPLLDNNLKPFLQKIPKETKAKCNLMFFTNCQVFPDEELTKELIKFKKIDLYLSIDGYGVLNEYIRRNSKWKIIETNTLKWIKLAEKLSNLTLSLQTTISAYNVEYLEPLINWWTKITPDNYQIIFNPVKHPDYLSINIFNENKLKLIAQNILKYNYTRSGSLKGFVKYLQTSKCNGKVYIFNKFNNILEDK